jgi:arylsulfatase
MYADEFWMRDDKYLNRTDPSDVPADFYSTTSFTDEFINYLNDRKDEENPFFAYLPFTAPQWPLQAPRSLIEKYKRRYNDGPDALRSERLQKLIDLGIVKPDVDAAPMPKDDWNMMSAQERAESARKMEVYAAMVEFIDENIKER